MSSTPQEPPVEQSAPAQPEEGPRSEHGAGTAKPRGKRRHRRAVDPGRGPEPVWHRTAWEDDPRAWGDTDEGESDSDQRILREKPPHW
ncbi:hypothetical protein [Ruania albidiflava]|uniref:hypothetical protein n=1 Tax=Ruania albidiflava TaxID=366586 RepID=UPI0003B303EF|nr:hypothetical protein [Ruania albidiflava]